MAALNSIVIDVFRRLGREAGDLCLEGKQKVLGARALEGAVKMVFPGKIRECALNSGKEALETYQEFKESRKSQQLDQV